MHGPRCRLQVANMSSQQFSRHGMPAPSGGTPQIAAATAAAAATLVPVNQPSSAQGKRVTAGGIIERSQPGFARERSPPPPHLQVVEKPTAAEMLNTASRITHQLEEEEEEGEDQGQDLQHFEMTSRRPWWSDPTHRCRGSDSHKLPPKPFPSSLAPL